MEGSRRLSTGQTITLSASDERTLRGVYEYLAGYAARRTIEAQVEEKRAEVARLLAALPSSARLLLQVQTQSRASTFTPSTEGNNGAEADALLDQYYQGKELLQRLEDKLKNHSSVDHKISFKDLDAILRSLGPPFSKKQIEQMIWEVDENLDDLIDLDELQLTYVRNIADQTGSEPCLFFKILEFLIFDGPTHKGYIIEDDCMEILYARYGGANLEREMKLLFGSRLRAEGGDGTLDLASFLEVVLKRVGRRAFLF